jgi:hypothetical protein
MKIGLPVSNHDTADFQSAGHSCQFDYNVTLQKGNNKINY